MVNKIRISDLSGITGKLKGRMLSSRVFPEELRPKLRPRASGGDEHQLWKQAHPISAAPPTNDSFSAQVSVKRKLLAPPS